MHHDWTHAFLKPFLRKNCHGPMFDAAGARKALADAGFSKAKTEWIAAQLEGIARADAQYARRFEDPYPWLQSHHWTPDD